MASQLVDNVRARFRISFQTEKAEPWTMKHEVKTCNTVEEIGSLIQEAFRQTAEVPIGDKTSSGDKKDIYVCPPNSHNLSQYLISYSNIIDDLIRHRVALESGKKMSYFVLVPEEKIRSRNELRVSAFIGPAQESTPAPVLHEDDDDHHGGGYSSENEGEDGCLCGSDECNGDCGILICRCINVCRCHTFVGEPW